LLTINKWNRWGTCRYRPASEWGNINYTG